MLLIYQKEQYIIGKRNLKIERKQSIHYQIKVEDLIKQERENGIIEY
jgi:hypothetical protein